MSGGRNLLRAIAPAVGFYVMAFAIVLATLTIWGAAQWRQRVEQLVPGGAAERAGLLPGDVFISFNGQPIDEEHALLDYLERSSGAPVRIAIERAGALRTLEVIPERTDRGLRIGVRLGLSSTRKRAKILRSLRTSATVPFEKAGGLLAAVPRSLGLLVHPEEEVAVGPAGGLVSAIELRSRGRSDELVFSLAGALVIVGGIVLLLPMGALNGGGIVRVLWDSVRRRVR